MAMFLHVVVFLSLTVKTAPGADAPYIEPIPDDSVSLGNTYTGPTPVLVEGMLPVTWTLVAGPTGMAIEASTGIVSWANATAEGSPHTIKIRASNDAGINEVSWHLIVTRSAITWEPVELTFTSNEYFDWFSFPLQVTFTNASTTITVDGYWDGGNTWKVRFAPVTAGLWNWISRSEDGQMDGVTGAIVAEPPDAEDIQTNPNYRGHLRVSNNNRYFEYDDGTPFFWIGDTNWALPYERCGVDNGNFYTYLNDRISKNFNVIQIQYVPPFAVNEGGVAISSYPDNWSELNPGFFQSLDIRIHEIWKNGLVVAGHPTWFGELFVSLEEAKRISRYLLARYGAYNIVYHCCPK